MPNEVLRRGVLHQLSKKRGLWTGCTRDNLAVCLAEMGSGTISYLQCERPEARSRRFEVLHAQSCGQNRNLRPDLGPVPPQLIQKSEVVQTDFQTRLAGARSPRPEGERNLRHGPYIGTDKDLQQDLESLAVKTHIV